LNEKSPAKRINRGRGACHKARQGRSDRCGSVGSHRRAHGALGMHDGRTSAR